MVAGSDEVDVSIQRCQCFGVKLGQQCALVGFSSRARGETLADAASEGPLGDNDFVCVAGVRRGDDAYFCDHYGTTLG